MQLEPPLKWLLILTSDVMYLGPSSTLFNLPCARWTMTIKVSLGDLAWHVTIHWLAWCICLGVKVRQNWRYVFKFSRAMLSLSCGLDANYDSKYGVVHDDSVSPISASRGG